MDISQVMQSKLLKACILMLKIQDGGFLQTHNFVLSQAFSIRHYNVPSQ